jgi:hypothetical protein
MKEPKRFLRHKAEVYKVVGLSFKPNVTSTETEEKVIIGFKIGDWNDPINFIPYFRKTERLSAHLH